MALTFQSPLDRPRAAPPTAADDYLLQTDIDVERTPARVRLAHLLQVVLVLIIAALSLALFWMIGLMLGVL